MLGKDTLYPIFLGAKILSEAAIVSTAADRLDSTLDEAAFIFQMPKDMTFDEVGVLVEGLTGAPDYDISIQGVNLADGKPDGTIIGSTGALWSPTADGFQWITLGNPLARSKNNLIAIVIEDGTTGTDPSGGNYVDLVSQAVQVGQNQMPYLHISADTGSTWTAAVNELPIIALRNSGTTTDVIGRPIEEPHALITLTTGVGHIIAQEFMLPVESASRVQVHGLQIHLAATNTDFDMGIFDGAGATVIATSRDKDARVGTATNSPLCFFTPTWLQTGVVYYAGLKQTDTGGNQAIYAHDCLTDDNLSAWPGYPNNNLAKYVSGWTPDVGGIAVGIALLVSAVDRRGIEMQHLEAGISR